VRSEEILSDLKCEQSKVEKALSLAITRQAGGRKANVILNLIQDL